MQPRKTSAIEGVISNLNQLFKAAVHEKDMLAEFKREREAKKKQME